MARNNVNNQGANVGIGSDPTAQLYNFAVNGGGFTKLQRDPNSLGGAAGEAIATAQIVQQGIQSIGGAINTGMNMYTDEKSRQFKAQMLDTLQDTERNLMTVDDPEKHKEIYQNTIDNLNTQLSKYGIMKSSDIDGFKNIISKYRNNYQYHNDELKKRKVGNDADVITGKLSSVLSTVKSDHITDFESIKMHSDDIYNMYKENGFTDTEAKQESEKQIMFLLLAGANSIANPLNQSVYYKNLLEKDKNGDYVYFNDKLDGKERLALLDKIKYQGAKDEYQKTNLDIELGNAPSRKQILSSVMMDDAQKASLLSRLDRAIDSRHRSGANQQIDNALSDNILHTKSEFYNMLNVNNVQNKEQVYKQFAKKRDDFENGSAVDMMLQNPFYQNMPRENVIAQIRSNGGNQNSILTNQEMDVFADDLNNAKTAQDKLNVINFKTQATQYILNNMRTENPDQFIQRYKNDILRQAKDSVMSPIIKTSLEMMSRQRGDVKNMQIAKQLIDIESEGRTSRLPLEKTDKEVKSFINDGGVMDTLNSYSYTRPIAERYAKAYKVSGLSQTDFLDALGLRSLRNSNKDIVYNYNDFSKDDLNKTLDSVINDDSFFTDSMLKNKDFIKKARSHGRWINDGIDRGFVYIYDDKVIGRVDVDYSGKKPSLNPVENPYNTITHTNNQIMNDAKQETVKLFLGNEYK